MSIEVRQIGEKNLKEFIALPFRLYQKDKNWVPPLVSSMKKMLDPQKNKFLKSPHACFMAYRDSKPVARILAGQNVPESQAYGTARGYFSLFEAEDMESGVKVVEAAQEYLKRIGMRAMKGPYSPTNGEENRLLLTAGFDLPPVLDQTYNPAWYRDVFERAGFTKTASDMLAFKIVPDDIPFDKFRKVVAYAKERYGFEAVPIDLTNLDKELPDIHSILNESDARDWGSGVPSWDNILQAADAMKTMADPDLVYIVRRNDGKPLAFVVSVPNYNEALIHTNGRLFPFGLFKFLYWKKRITGIRIMMQFCVKDYEHKAAVSAAYLAIMEAAIKKGYKWGDASTISEANEKSWRPVVTAGGKLYKRFSYFEKEI